MIDVKTAIEIVLNHVTPLPAEQVWLPEAVGRVLAGDVRSDVDMPAFNRATMDGYALRAGDYDACEGQFRVVGAVYAGQVADFEVGPGQAAKIMTGAPVPPGADAVQKIEVIDEEDGRVHVREPVKPGQNVARQGEDVKVGNVVLPRGAYLSPPRIGVLAGVGAATVSVYGTPRVSVISTGDELVDVGVRPAPGQIRNTNAHALRAALSQMAIENISPGNAPDDVKGLTAMIARGLDADVLLLTGGVSMGELDLVAGVLGDLGVDLKFKKVAIKPGKPTVFGTKGGKLIFGLPGNPVSATTTFDVFVRPALRKLMGLERVENRMVPARALEAFRNPSRREFFAPARVALVGGIYEATPVVTHGSGDLVGFSASDCYALIPPEVTEAAPGQTVNVMLRDDHASLMRSREGV